MAVARDAPERREVLLVERDAVEPDEVHPAARAGLVLRDFLEHGGVDGHAARERARIARKVLRELLEGRELVLRVGDELSRLNIDVCGGMSAYSSLHRAIKGQRLFSHRREHQETDSDTTEDHPAVPSPDHKARFWDTMVT